MLYPAGTELRRSNYRILGLVGQGQFGQVFCALHRPTGQFVALKNLEQDRFPTHKFLRELRFLLSLQHPNIVTCQALEHTSTGRYLVMDYCEGGTLRGLMAEESRLSLPYAVKLIEDILAGLDHAHSRGIVHCDIKPENILVQLDPRGWMARISDFGIARLRQDIQIWDSATGSPAYMAPERFYGQYSAASDLYSVGILLFELITGYRPFAGTPAELMSAHLNQPLQFPDSLPLIWQPVIAKALQKLPGRRFRSAVEMLEAVRLARVADTPAFPDLPATQDLPPLFFTVLVPPHCRFEPTRQQPLEQEIGQLAAAPASLTQNQSSEVTSTEIWQATATQIGYWVEQSATSEISAPAWVTCGTIAAPIQQLLMRPQGCFVVTRRSLELLSRYSGQEAEQEAEQAIEAQTLATWEHGRAVAIDPQGNWVALLDLGDSREPAQLTFQRLPAAKAPLITSTSIVVTGGEWMEMLALDSRHLVLFWNGSPNTGTGTTVSLRTRRGHDLGGFNLPLDLRHVSLTPRPYRLLATDHHSGTVLLLDLKPYRIRRIWVEISPQFLLAADWGYILADTDGRLVFLDQTGQPIGQLNVPPQITALALWQNQLWLATWDATQGMLYRLGLHQLGLDLIF